MHIAVSRVTTSRTTGTSTLLTGPSTTVSNSSRSVTNGKSRSSLTWSSTSKSSALISHFFLHLKSSTHYQSSPPTAPSSCSDEHKWFKESRSSLDNPKRNWFMWRKPKGFTEDGKPIPPNNWRAAFGGSVWEWDEGTQEYYLHLFAVGQPDFVSPTDSPA